MHAQLLDGHGLEVPSSGTIIGAFNNCNQPFAAPLMPMPSTMHVIYHHFFACHCQGAKPLLRCVLIENR